MSRTNSGAQSWEVTARGSHCKSTDIPFEDGQVVMSRLLMTENDGVQREDYSLKAWSDELRDGSFVYWKTAYTKPAPKKEEPFKEENADEAFRDLLEKNEEEDRTTLFVLAVMLERKRLFVEQGSQRDPEGNLMRIYEHKDSGETFLVFDPEIPLENIRDVQMEVALNLGWIEPEPEPEEEPEEEADEVSEDAETGEAATEPGDAETVEEHAEQEDDDEVLADEK